MNTRDIALIVTISFLFSTLVTIEITGELENSETESSLSIDNQDIIQILNQITDKTRTVEKNIGEKHVTYYEHTVDDIEIKNDYILIHEDTTNNNIIKFEKNWRDIDAYVQNFNSIEFSTMNIADYYWKNKVVFLDENDCSDFYSFHSSMEFPKFCWEVRYEDGRTLLYDISGEEIGKGITAPSEGFLMTGPHEGNDVWNYLRSNAQSYYTNWVDSITSIFNPYPSTEITPKVSDPNVELFFEVAHGGSTSFKAHNNAYYYSSTSSKDNVKADMTNRQPMKFAFIGSCNGMSSTGEGKFSYEFRKGQMVNTVTVGYHGMGDDDGWPKAKPWQNAMFSKMDQGYTIKYSFDYACGEYPTIADAVKFVGDENLKIVETGNQPPYTPHDPSPEDNSFNLPVNVLLSWQCSDPNDGDIVYYDVYLEANNPNPNVEVSNDQTSLAFQSNSLSYNTDYYWRISARDNHDQTTEGPVWHFKTTEYAGENIDQQQDQSDSTLPLNSVSDTAISSNSYAQSFKPDETVLSYVKLFLKKDGNPGQISVNIRSNLDGNNLASVSRPSSNIPSTLGWVDFDFTDINVNTASTYYIVVSAEGTDSPNRYLLSAGINTAYTDGMLYISKNRGEIWDDPMVNHDLTFRTYTQGGSTNAPPNDPTSLSPYNGKTNVNIGEILSWNGGDPDSGDTVTYEVYFGKTSNPAITETIGPYPATQNLITYDPSDLEYSTQYYWKIKSIDNHGKSKTSSIYNFKTQEKLEAVIFEVEMICQNNFGFKIINNGEDTLDNIDWEIEITGTIFGRINITDSGSISSINPGNDIDITVNEDIFGLDIVMIHITLQVNDKTIEDEKTGLVLGKFILIF